MLEHNFNEEGYIENMNKLDEFIENLSINDLSDTVITIKNVPNGDFKIFHQLGRKPNFRIVLKQIGGGYILDQDRAHTDKLMYLHNSGNIIKELKLLVG